MTVSRHTVAATINGTALSPLSASLTLDAGYEPYTRATIRLAQPTAALLALLDPRAVRRVRGEIRQDFGVARPLSARTARFAGQPLSARTAAFAGQPLRTRTAGYFTPWNAAGVVASRVRPFDLALRGRSIDHAAAEVTLELASDEALLQDDRLLASTPYSFLTTNVRDIVSIVLGRIGATLEPGTADGHVAADSAVWQPGVTASDFLEPLTEAVGVKLRCDEMRRWYLEPLESTRPGQINLSAAGTVTGLRDEISRTGDAWFDGVIIEYTWRDDANVEQRAFDYAPTDGSATRVQIVTRQDTRYPGPGAAARHLRALRGKGRELTPTAVSDPLTEPGQACLVTFPGGDAQTGYVRAVTWNWPDDEMTVTTRGLIDTPATAWAFDPAGIAWNAIPTGTDWTEDN